jgi:hypothetical protein
MSREQDTLHKILETVFLPVRMFEVAIVRPCAWIYHSLLRDASGGAQPPTPTPEDLKPAEAFNLFVWLQQRLSGISAYETEGAG